MRITWLSHSCFLIESGPHRLLVDPYLTGNPRAPVAASEMRCTHVLCTHAHEDHLGDSLQIAQANQAPIIAAYELAEYLSAHGARTIDLMPGGSAHLEFGQVQLTPAIHSCALEQPKGANLPLGIACGLLLTVDGKRIYHAGDTALFSDLRLIGRHQIDVACVPVGDWYTMGIDDAVLALEYLCPELTLPMHYGTNNKIAADPHAFARKAAEAGHRVRVLAPGESVEI